MQVLHGFCLSHLTLRSEQRTQDKADLVGAGPDEGAKGFIAGRRCDQRYALAKESWIIGSPATL